MDSVVSWLLLTIFSLYGVLRLFIAIINEAEAKKKNSELSWNDEEYYW